jgi:chemotaxis signal transduction protein
MSVPVSKSSHCIFNSGEGWFALPTVNVRRVVGNPSVALIPRSHPILAGLCHAGSEFIPVLRLSKANADANGQMLVVDGPNGRWGLLVEHIVSIELIECSSDTDGHQDEWSTAITGSSLFRNRIVRVLSSDELYLLAERTLRTDWSNAGIATVA